MRMSVRGLKAESLVDVYFRFMHFVHILIRKLKSVLITPRTVLHAYMRRI